MLNDGIKVFMAVVDKKSFSKAAKSLFLTQPAVSFQIQTLEQYYGTILFNRVNRNISLTQAGHLLFKYAKEMIKIQAELEREMQELTGTIKGKLKIGASTTIGEYVLPILIGKFKKLHPQVDISLEINNTEKIRKHILDTSLDIGLVEGPVQGKDLHIEKFLEDELVLIIPPNHPWANKEKISVFELKDYPFIMREKGSGTREVIERSLEKVGFPSKNLNIIMELGNTTAIKAAVKNNLGVSIISKWAAKDYLKLEILRKVSIEEISFTRQFTVINHNKKYRIHAEEEFLNYINNDKIKDILIA